MSLRFNIIILIGMLAAAWLPASVIAVSPSNDAIRVWTENGELQQHLDQWKAFADAGGCSAEKITPLTKSDRTFSFAASETIDSAHVLVILVEFPDYRMADQSISGGPTTFYEHLFTDSLHSMSAYYDQVSGGRFHLDGTVTGPIMMPGTYDSYVGLNSGLTGSPLLARQAIDAAASIGIDFNTFDANHDNVCDGILIVHPGPGAETGVDNAIWSHKSNVFGQPTYDGVFIPAYTMNPEERGSDISGIGVYCHEYGHILGLPDLYDISGTPGSNGIGNFGLMGTGSWLGYGNTPSHLSAWSKIKLGWMDAVYISANTYQTAIPQSGTNPTAFVLRPTMGSRYEYWIVENRQRTGYDRLLPTAGLCIYHVDEFRHDNTDPSNYMVAIEQADGDNALAFGNSSGDAGDLWPGSTNNRDFNDRSIPSSRTNGGSTTQVGVWNISDPDSIMYADFDVTYSRPMILPAGESPISFVDSPGGDGDGVFEAGERISVALSINNVMRPVYNIRVQMSSSSGQLTMPDDNASITQLLDNRITVISGPLSFDISDTLVPTIDSISLTIVADSLESGGGGEYTASFAAEISLGQPQILLVDDDRGATYENAYHSALHSLRLPHDVWDINTDGQVSGDDLSQYRTVIWFTGDSTNGALGTDDAAAIRSYLDGGGSIILSTISGANDLTAKASSLLSDYFGAAVSGSSFSPWVKGSESALFASGLDLVYQTSGPPPTQLTTFTPVGNATEELLLYGGPGDPNLGCVGVSHNGGSYHTVLTSLPLEYLGDRINTAADFLQNALTWLGGGTIATAQTSSGARLPQSFSLHQNYPNPFNPSTTIAYELAFTGGRPVRLDVYNMLGQRVRTLVDRVQPGGRYTIVWEGRNETGERVASGVYLYRLTVDGSSSSHKMVLLK